MPPWNAIWRRAPALDVYLARQALWLARGDERLLAIDGEPDATLPALNAWWRKHGEPRLSVWLSGALCRPFLLPPVAGLRNANDIAAIAQAQASALTGLSGPCSVWIEPAMGDQPSVGAAMPAALRERLLALGRAGGAGGGAVASVRPWWAAVLDAVLKQESVRSALLVQDADSVVFLAGEGDRFTAATVHAPIVAGEVAQAVRSRLAMTHELTDVHCTTAVLCGGEVSGVAWRIPFARWTRLEKA